jgi:hypothetical protein
MPYNLVVVTTVFEEHTASFFMFMTYAENGAWDSFEVLVKTYQSKECKTKNIHKQNPRRL